MITESIAGRFERFQLEYYVSSGH